MTSITTIRPPVRAAFDALIDYAGLFPPAKLGMAAAAGEYRAAAAGPHAWMLGRFIVPASRGRELAQALAAAAGPPVSLSVIAEGSSDPRRWFSAVQASLDEVARLRDDEGRVRVAAVEVALPPLATARETFDATVGQLGALVERAGLRELPVYAELPRGPRWMETLSDAMTALSRARLNAKLRCGGVTPDAFPSIDDVAAFIEAAANEGVAFKATAGLHHPVRHFNQTAGTTMHGFLNLFAASAFAGRLDAAMLREAIAEEDARAFTFDDATFGWRGERAGVDDLRAVRAVAFNGYGSCSFGEPVADLIALDLLGAGA
jgi:hypothetical protein